MKRVLVINADDYGEAKFSSAITMALKRGLVTSATLLIGRQDSEECIRFAASMRVKLGLHVNLTVGRPVSNLADVPTLVTEDGEFLGKTTFERRLEHDQIKPAEIRRECTAQLERFCKLVGTYPQHVDGHHHIQARPVVARELAPACAERGIQRLRLPIEANRHFDHVTPERRRWAQDLVEDALIATDAYAAEGMRWPHFMGIGYGFEAAELMRIVDRLHELPDGVTEYMVHISRPGELPRTDEAHRREHEWRALVALHQGTVLEDLNIALGTYGDL